MLMKHGQVPCVLTVLFRPFCNPQPASTPSLSGCRLIQDSLIRTSCHPSAEVRPVPCQQVICTGDGPPVLYRPYHASKCPACTRAHADDMPLFNLGWEHKLRKGLMRTRNWNSGSHLGPSPRIHLTLQWHKGHRR